MIVKVRARLDAETHFNDLIEQADLTCLGPQETSEYSVLSVNVHPADEPDTWDIEVEVERSEGANASRASIIERLIAALDEGDNVSGEEA